MYFLPFLKLFFLCVCVTSPEQARLCELEDQSKASKKGMWSEGGGTHTIRDMKYTIENPRNFVDSLHQKPINGNEFWEGHADIHPDTLIQTKLGLGNKQMAYKNLQYYISLYFPIKAAFAGCVRNQPFWLKIFRSKYPLQGM